MNANESQLALVTRTLAKLPECPADMLGEMLEFCYRMLGECHHASLTADQHRRYREMSETVYDLRQAH
jgi:hypothetical protein